MIHKDHIINCVRVCYSWLICYEFKYFRIFVENYNQASFRIFIDFNMLFTSEFYWADNNSYSFEPKLNFSSLLAEMKQFDYQNN